MRVFLSVVCVLAFAAGAGAARLPGVKTPSRNIRCFYVPIKGTFRGSLLCTVERAVYARALQHRCIDGPAGLDWHGFVLPAKTAGQVACSGGILYDVRDTPTFTVLGYGRTWRYRGFTCTSRVTGLTCRNGTGHGLFLSRTSYRVF